MSGVIDENGVQWEHCNVCGGWVQIEFLLYEKPSPDHPFGLDLCAKCSEGREVQQQELLRISLDQNGQVTAVTRVEPGPVH